MSKVTTAKPEAKSSKKLIHGTAVRFYKRTEKANYTMDFEVMGERVQESTGWPTLADAERVALKRVREVKERKQGLDAAGLGHQKVKGKCATVQEVLAAMDEGTKVWGAGTLRTYKSGLLRLARVADAKDPEGARIDTVLSESNVERFYAEGQGLAAVNWADALEANCGLNTTIRNTKAIFTPRVLKLKFSDLKLPNLAAFRETPLLRQENEGFVPWPEGVYERMDEEAKAMRETEPEKWLVNAMLRRLGLRDEELLSARREWIELKVSYGAEDMGPPLMRAWLVVGHSTGFEVLKHGKARKLELDPELMSILLPRTGYLIADGWVENDRYNLIYREHNAFMRRFIPDRTKGNHELRMWAGSIIYMKHGLEAAANFLGHKSTVTTERYYAAFLSTAPILTGEAVAAAAVVQMRIAS